MFNRTSKSGKRMSDQSPKLKIIDFKKDDKYYKNIRNDLLSILEEDTKICTVLDVGCGFGFNADYLKTRFHVNEIIGIDNKESLEKEALKRIDKFILGDIEKISLDKYKNYFNLIVFADVLEHLYNPWGTVAKVKECLKDDGKILVSIPNVRHFSILLNLILGKWEYKEEGLLDLTHIRFFTKQSIKAMFSMNNLRIIKMKSIMGTKTKILNLLSLYLFSGILTYRYFLLIEKDKRE